MSYVSILLSVCMSFCPGALLSEEEKHSPLQTLTLEKRSNFPKHFHGVVAYLDSTDKLGSDKLLLFKTEILEAQLMR